MSTVYGNSTIDNPTWLQLNEQPADSGIFISTNQLLVADDIDDVFSNSQTPSDDGFNDRTHKIALDGEVKVKYPRDEESWLFKGMTVAATSTVHVIPIIMRTAAATNGGSPVMITADVRERLEKARARYAQVGVNVTWSEPEVCDPPSGVNLLNGLTVRTNNSDHVLAREAKDIIEACGTIGTTTDIHIFYVTFLDVGTENPPGGMAVTREWFNQPSEAPYLYNIFIKADSNPEGAGYALAHEMGHLLNNPNHASEKWRLMHEEIDLNGVFGSRRFVTSEAVNIHGDPHVHNP